MENADKPTCRFCKVSARRYHGLRFANNQCPTVPLLQIKRDPPLVHLRYQKLRQAVDKRNETASQLGKRIIKQGSLKDTLCPFETWLFPPK